MFHSAGENSVLMIAFFLFPFFPGILVGVVRGDDSNLLAIWGSLFENFFDFKIGLILEVFSPSLAFPSSRGERRGVWMQTSFRRFWEFVAPNKGVSIGDSNGVSCGVASLIFHSIWLPLLRLWPWETDLESPLVAPLDLFTLGKEFVCLCSP